MKPWRRVVAGLIAAAVGAGGLPAYAAESPGRASLADDRVLEALGRRACEALVGRSVPLKSGSSVVLVSVAGCATMRASAPRINPRLIREQTAQDLPDGTLFGRKRLASNSAVAIDIIAYSSSGLIVGGLLCYPNDGRSHSVVIHVPGGLGGVFSQTVGDMVQTCINWASLHGRTAFAPSLRGNDGGEGEIEICRGEADDVVAAAAMVRTLEVAEPARVAVLGGSIGGCVALHAAPRIPNLAAVVAFVPPTSWKDLIDFHRTRWEPATETDCDGIQREWTIGGTELADALDSVICHHAGCSDDEYLARSPLPYVSAQTAPTLIVSAEMDTVVPVEQQLLWSLFRQSSGFPVDVLVVDKCDAPGTPPLTMDVHLFALRANHLLSGGPISSGMLFLMAQLDRIAPFVP